MKKTTVKLAGILFTVMLLLMSTPFAGAGTPIKMIFDTDMGNDVDDPLALAVIHYFQAQGEIELLAVTTTKDNECVVPYIKLINNFYGYPNIPVGSIKSGIETFDGRYLRQLLETKDEKGNLKFNPKGYKAGDTGPDSVELMRKTLAGIKKGKAVIVQVGFSTNMARLLDTKGDKYSPLSGKELVKEKVEYLSIMAGGFPPKFTNHKEYNIVKDIPSAKKFLSECPVPVVSSGFEIGAAILMPGIAMQKDYNYIPNHPLQESYRHYRGFDKDQCTFDLTSVLYVARPDRGYFDLSEPGTINVLDDGRTTFTPSANGKHRIMKVNDIQIARVREAFIWICSFPPQK